MADLRKRKRAPAAAEDPVAARRKNELQRQARLGDPERHRKYRALQCHGPHYAEDFARFWEAQRGCCYLCEESLTDLPGQIVVDHDHACCPRTKSCRACRRGLACHRCNRLIGQFDDDPDQLRRLAGNLERVLAPARARIAAKASQLTMLENV